MHPNGTDMQLKPIEKRQQYPEKVQRPHPLAQPIVHGFRKSTALMSRVTPDQSHISIRTTAQ